MFRLKHLLAFTAIALFQLQPGFAASSPARDATPATTPKKKPQLRVDPTPLEAHPAVVQSYADVIEPVQKTVVSIYSTKVVRERIGNPLFKQGQMIVNSSILLPGAVGIDLITVTVPGFHISGSALPVLLRIGGASSSVTGPTVPHVAVN